MIKNLFKSHHAYEYDIFSITACYNRRHRRGGNSSSNSVQNSKSKQRRGSQDADEVDDDSLAADLLVSTVKNLRCLCAIMLDGVR